MCDDDASPSPDCRASPRDAARTLSNFNFNRKQRNTAHAEPNTCCEYSISVLSDKRLITFYAYSDNYKKRNTSREETETMATDPSYS